jgi:hypothetical protein
MTVVPTELPEQVGSGLQVPPPDGFVWGTAFTASGLSYRRLDYWTRCGYLKAAQDGHGSGYKRLWPDAELGIAVAIMRLVDQAGIELTRAVSIARDRRPSEGSWEVHVLAPGLRLVASPELWQP